MIKNRDEKDNVDRKDEDNYVSFIDLIIPNL